LDDVRRCVHVRLTAGARV